MTRSLGWNLTSLAMRDWPQTQGPKAPKAADRVSTQLVYSKAQCPAPHSGWPQPGLKAVELSHIGSDIERLV